MSRGAIVLMVIKAKKSPHILVGAFFDVPVLRSMRLHVIRAVLQ
jgi:hypothetical protein